MTAPGLGQIADLLGEPGPAGFGARLDRFWRAWGSFANDPMSDEARAAVLRSGRKLAGALNSLAEGFVAAPAAYRRTLDTVAAALATVVNEAQGRPVFAGSTAADVHVVLDDPALLVAGPDGEIAAALSQAAVHPGSPDASYAALVGTLANELARPVISAPPPDPAYRDVLAPTTRVYTAVDGLLATLTAHLGGGAGVDAASVAAVRDAADRPAQWGEQLSSGRRLSSPAADPAGTVEYLRLHSALSRAEGYVVACRDAEARLVASLDGAADDDSTVVRVIGEHAIVRIGHLSADSRESAIDLLERVRRAAITAASAMAATNSRLAELDRVDREDIAMRTATAEATYRAALATNAQCESRSLSEFLRPPT